MYRAAMPDRDRVRATAQLTDGGDSWASANSFSARQLWEWMPVDIFAQTIGTANTVAEMSELISSGLRLSRPCSLMPSALCDRLSSHYLSCTPGLGKRISSSYRPCVECCMYRQMNRLADWCNTTVVPFGPICCKLVHHRCGGNS